MVTRFGMSEKLGNVDLASNHNQLSAGTKELVETEVRRFTDEGYQRARNLLLSKRKELDRLAKALIEYETLNSSEAFKVIKGEKIDKPILPSGPIKIPEIPLGGIGSLPEIPPIPGSAADEPQGKEPPTGAAVAKGRDGCH
jgi:ATP-dependent metalloprotease